MVRRLADGRAGGLVVHERLGILGGVFAGIFSLWDTAKFAREWVRDFPGYRGGWIFWGDEDYLRCHGQSFRDKQSIFGLDTGVFDSNFARYFGWPDCCGLEKKIENPEWELTECGDCGWTSGARNWVPDLWDCTFGASHRGGVCWGWSFGGGNFLGSDAGGGDSRAFEPEESRDGCICYNNE